MIYPSCCLYCREFLADREHILCEGCFSLLEFLEGAGRCVTCFDEGGRCAKCAERPPWTYRVAAAFDHWGPAASLLYHYKCRGQWFLAEGIAALMAVQWVHLGWPLPDLIMPVPSSPESLAARGYCQAGLLAKELGRLLGVPVIEGMAVRMGYPRQRSLRTEARSTLDAEQFRLKKELILMDQVVLLVDDSLVTGGTLSACTVAMMPAYPSHVYGLTFTKS